MKYKVARFKHGGAQAAAQKQRADALCRILVFCKKQDGGARQRAPVSDDLGKKGITCAPLQTVNNEGERPLGMQLLL